MSYRNQLLDDLKLQHGKILAAIAEKEREIQALQDEFYAVNNEFNEKQAAGLVIQEAMSYKTTLKVLENKIKDKNRELATLQKQADAKQAEVIAAKQDAMSLEKLKEQRLKDYNAAAMKEEEKFIEEFVANTAAAERS